MEGYRRNRCEPFRIQERPTTCRLLCSLYLVFSAFVFVPALANVQKEKHVLVEKIPFIVPNVRVLHG